MSTPTWIKQILAGGLPEVLDLGDQAPNGDENQNFEGSNTPPERRPPSGYRNFDTANMGFGFNQNQLMQAGIAIAGVVFVVYLAKRL